MDFSVDMNLLQGAFLFSTFLFSIDIIRNGVIRDGGKGKVFSGKI